MEGSLVGIPLPPGTWAVMVHQNYLERVKEYFDPAEEVTTLHTPVSVSSSTSSANKPTKRRRRNKKQLGDSDYQTILCRRVRKPPDSWCLSAFARQNISWTTRILFTAKAKGDLHLSGLAKALYQTCQLDKLVMSQTDKLRVDVHPRHLLEPICQALQQQAAANDSFGRPADADPFEGNIPMTASRTNCEARLTVVVEQEYHNNNAQSQYSYYWGYDQRPDDNAMIDIRLNHQAQEEIDLVPMAAPDGSEPIPAPAVSTPLSRAYYKLAQVLTDFGSTLSFHNSYGIDVGASPGGWTQVLVHQLLLQHVWAIDKAVLARRITNLSQVTHIPCRLQGWKLHAKSLPPISVLVSDASILWRTLWQDVATHIFPLVTWKLPVLMVFTCKLPHDRSNNVAKQIVAIQQALPVWIDKHLRPCFADDDVTIESHMLHLFANSTSERTMVVLARPSVGSSSTSHGKSKS